MANKILTIEQGQIEIMKAWKQALREIPRNRAVAVHLLDPSKKSLNADIGTRCGIRLRLTLLLANPPIKKYHAQAPGAINFDRERHVTKDKKYVTCARCKRKQL